MAFQTSRQASPLLSSLLRLRPLPIAPNLQILPSARRCLHQEQQQREKEPAVAYEPKPTRLPHATKRFHNARPQPRAPYPIRARKHFAVNDDPKVLNAMYLKLFGKDLGLSDEVKWQAITHKSFDHGRQPFNSKLRFLGKRLLQMHTSFHLLAAPQPHRPGNAGKRSQYISLEGAQYQRPQPFTHEDYKNLENVTGKRIEHYIGAGHLLPLITETGLADVMRWKPAEISDLERSGRVSLAIDCLHAIVGAVALQKGGDVAAQFIRERILKSETESATKTKTETATESKAETTS